MLAEALEKEGMEVVEELSTGPKVYNDKVEVVSADFVTLHLVDNIRKLGKRGDAKRDLHRQHIVDAVKERTKSLFHFFSLPSDVAASVPLVPDDFGGDMFGSDEFGSDMFMSSMSASAATPTPVKIMTETSTSPNSVVIESLEHEHFQKETVLKVEQEPAAPSMGGFSFSLDEDF